MSKIITCKVSLPGGGLPIWRRFQVRDDYRLDRFHQVIQIVMEWLNYHLHEFEIKGQRYGMILNIDDGFDAGLDENKAYLKDFQFQPGDQFTYLYDFGDSWQHLLEIEAVADGELLVPICLDGKNATPPEDFGGIGGYMDLITVWKDPKHPNHDMYVNNYLPESFDPYTFNRQAINNELKKFGQWHNKHPRKKSTPWHQV